VGKVIVKIIFGLTLLMFRPKVRLLAHKKIKLLAHGNKIIKTKN